MITDVDAARRAHRQLAGYLCVALFVLSLMFWGLVFNRSILALDDMSLIVRGQSAMSSAQDVYEIFRRDVVVQNGRIADGTLSVVAMLGETAVRVYFAVASALLFPTALIWLTYLTPRAARQVLPAFVLPVAAAALPWLMLALDRRLISQLVLFGAASSGYFTGLFLVTLGLVPVLRILNGIAVSRRAVAVAAAPLLVGVMFHEVLGALVLGVLIAVVLMAVRSRDLRSRLMLSAGLLAVAVALKAATPGLWSRAADADQRQASDASLLGRTDLAIAFALVAFVPLGAYVVGSLALSLHSRGVSNRRLGLVGLLGAGLVAVGLGYRVIGGFPVNGVVTILALVVMALVAANLRSADVEPSELVGLGAMVLALCVPVYGGLLPGRAWFFGEFMALIIASAALIRALAASAASRFAGAQFMVVALLGAGVVVAPVLAYELLDKVNDNYAWRAYVDGEVAGQSDGSVEIPWTYPWNDMKPSFVLDDDHESYEDLTRAYFDIPDDTDLVWTGSVDWAAD
jgi:hypothetical protein